MHRRRARGIRNQAGPRVVSAKYGSRMSSNEVAQGPGPSTAGSKWRSVKTELIFVLGAYSPLALLMGVISAFDDHLYMAFTWMLVFLLLVLMTASAVAKPKDTLGASTVMYSDSDEQGSAVSGYLATYLLPFVALPTGAPGPIAGYAVFFILVALLHLRSNLGLINPSLYILGWRVSRVFVAEKSRFLVHRGEITRNGSMLVVSHQSVLIQVTGTRK